LKGECSLPMNALRVLWNAETVVSAEARVRWDLAPVFCWRGCRDRFSPGRRRTSGSLQLGRRSASSVIRLLQRHSNTARAASLPTSLQLLNSLPLRLEIASGAMRHDLVATGSNEQLKRRKR
ncbi:MAG: hypothetical protein ACR2PI_03190, partial [Hyphomicrobiaceae bacterium]